MLTLGCLGVAGLWVGFSNQFGARFIRGVIAETGRGIQSPAAIPQPNTWNPNSLTASWLGHSTVLLNFFGVNILTDPVLFSRVGADLRVGTVGIKRLVSPALTADQLPPIDVVLLSHAHHDHLNFPSLRQLPASARVVTARATSDLLRRTHFNAVTELGWGDRATLATPQGDLSVSAFEVNHWGARWKHDRHRGYNGYVIEREGRKIIFGGDTAMSSTFRPLRAKGPYDLAIMPIGSYRPWEHSHCTPEQALAMANDAAAEYFLPIHYKTFVLGKEGPTEPIERLQAAIEPQRIALRDIGETFRLN
jgi:L-ascorbate metabolism protein UlaG (beta-lactamase superfamily)